MKTTDVVIVGAGLAGLCTARALARRGLEVLVLEARDRLGGRLASRRANSSGLVVDMGAQWHGPGQTRILALASELGVESYATHIVGKKQYEFMGRSGSYGGSAPLSQWPAFVGAGLGAWQLTRLARVMGKQASSLQVASEQRSLGEWIDRQVRPRSARHLLRFMFQSLFCCDPSDVSLLLALHWLSKCGDLTHMLSVEGGSQERQFVGGTAELIARLSQPLSAQILLSHPVRQIRRDTEGASVCGDGFEVRARRVVVALPPPLVCEIDFTPELQKSRAHFLSRLRMGSVTKCVAVYDTPFWRAQGLSGETWSDEGTLTGTYDTSPPASAYGTLVGLIAGPQADKLAGLAPEERQQITLSDLARYFGPEAARPIEYFEQAWSSEEWTRGGYSAYCRPSDWAPNFSALYVPDGVVHWAGTETAAAWPGYMEGAIESSERVVLELTAA